MSELPLTPEQVVGEMTCDEVRELLTELSMESTPAAANRLQRLIRDLGRFEAAIEAMAGPAQMRKAA